MSEISRRAPSPSWNAQSTAPAATAAANSNRWFWVKFKPLVTARHNCRMATLVKQHARRQPGGKTRADKAPSHIEFLQRFKGSLPETIARSDINTLNTGLGHLFARLRKARRLFDKQKDGGRAAAFTALGAMWQFIVLFESPHAQLLHVPILTLQNALAALEDNNVRPILKPVARSGRGASSQAHATLMGFAVGTVRRLLQAGLDRKPAFEAVAKVLAQQGVRPQRGSGAITADTIRHWSDEVEADVGRRGTAARAFDSMFLPEENARFDALRPADARRQARGSLAHYVQQFPELRAGKPS
jgi:hypothetical protein